MSFDCSVSTLQLFAENRARLVEALKPHVPQNSVVFLVGGIAKKCYATGEDLPFRQESYFFWAFGVRESQCYGVIDVSTGKCILFPLKLSTSCDICEETIGTKSWFKNRYEVDEVHFQFKGNIKRILNTLGAQNVLLLRAYNEESDDWLEPIVLSDFASFEIDEKILYPIFAEARVIKTDAELEVMRYTAKIACNAQKRLMRHIRPNMFEYQMERFYQRVCFSAGGCQQLTYSCVADSSKNEATLHYDDANVPSTNDDLTLFDMSPNYICYASDIACSFPSNGKFTNRQKLIYNVVLKAANAVFDQAKPGVRWTDMHLLAERVMLTELKAIGIVVGDIEKALKVRLGAIFMPHGLGHFIGVDVHDVGGYLGDAIPRSKLPGLNNLRTTRTLQERMVITIEPSCSFVESLLNFALSDDKLSKFLNKEVLETYRGTAGVLIEDNVVIWANGNENLSSSLPRTVEEIEKYMAKKCVRKLY